MSSAQDKSVPE